MTISIIGLGYVGLPLALQADSRGLQITGVDKNPAVLEALGNRKSMLNDKIVTELLPKSGLTLTDRVFGSKVYIVCVPTPVVNFQEPDLRFVKSASEEIASVLRDNDLVIIESTINPGVCEEVVAPILARSGKKFGLAHCPERINPGDPNWDVRNIPRVVGGLMPEDGVRARDVYSKIIDAEITILSQIRAAEATKILENTFRDVNIAFINEMAMSFHRLGIDISEVIRGASTKPFAFLPHSPGIGVGGHCIAVDPYYMISKGREVGFIHDFLIEARRINSGMPEFGISVLQDGLNEIGLPINGTSVSILGVSYKPNVADERESPFFEVHRLLKKRGAKITVYDPHFPQLSTVGTMKEACASADAIIIVTAHKEFLDVSNYKNVKFILDGRNCLDRAAVQSLGIIIAGIGIDSELI